MFKNNQHFSVWGGASIFLIFKHENSYKLDNFATLGKNPILLHTIYPLKVFWHSRYKLKFTNNNSNNQNLLSKNKHTLTACNIATILRAVWAATGIFIFLVTSLSFNRKVQLFKSNMKRLPGSLPLIRHSSLVQSIVRK